MPDDKAIRIAQGLARIGVAIKHNAWKEGTAQGLTPTQAQVLACIRTQGDAGGLSLNHIAAQLAITPATASDAVSSLVEKKRVRKRRGRTDARTIAISLTAKGKADADRAIQWPDFVASAVDSLSPAEQDVVLRSVVKMIATLQHRRQISAARVCASCQFFRPNVYRNANQPHHCDFVDAPFGDTALQTDCPDYDAASESSGQAIYQVFVNGMPATIERGLDSV